MSGVNGDGSAFQSHHLPMCNDCHWCSAHVTHWGFIFVQSGPHLVKGTTMELSLPVAVPCLFQTSSLTTERKQVTALQKRKLKSTSRITVLWYWCLRCWVPKSWSHKETWLKWDIQCMFISSCLMQSAELFYRHCREKLGWSWLEAQGLWSFLPPCSSYLNISTCWSPAMCKPGCIKSIPKSHQIMYVVHFLVAFSHDGGVGCDKQRLSRELHPLQG